MFSINSYTPHCFLPIKIFDLREYNNLILKLSDLSVETEKTNYAALLTKRKRIFMQTNTVLYENVTSKLNFTPNLDNSHIAVAVEDGIVKLEGKVHSLLEKRIAEVAVKSVSGVKAVANELAVEIPGKYQVADAEIASAIVNAFKWDVAVPKEQIQVTVEDGRVTLTGAVDWWFQRENAERAVRRITGVKSINNQVIIKPLVTAKDVKTEIIREFHRNAQLDALNIQVELSGHKVILTGTVRSWAEYKEAERGAFSAAGVTEVENKLRVSY